MSAHTTHTAHNGLVKGEYARVLIPFVLSTVTQPLIGAVDTAVMGRLPDPAYIAGVAIGAVIFNTIYWLLGFLRVGSTGFSAQAAMDGSDSALIRAMLSPILMALGLGILIIFLQQPIFAGAMLIMKLEPAAKAVTATYYYILIWTAPIVLVNYVLLGWLMGLTRIRASLVMQIGGNILNMILAPILVFVFDLAVAGVAIAAVCAHVFSLVIGILSVNQVLSHATSTKNEDAIHSWWHKLTAIYRQAKELFRLSDFLHIVNVNLNLFLRTVCLLAQTNIFMATATTFGTVTLSGNAVLTQIALIMAYVFEGIANASSVFAGRATGSKNYTLMHETYWLTIRWTMVTALVMAFIYALFHSQFFTCFTDLDEVLLSAEKYAWWVIGFALIGGPGFTIYGLFTGSSLTRPVFISTLLALLAFLAVWAVMVPLWGNHGLWLAYLVFYFGRSAFLAPRYKLLMAKAFD